MDTAWGASGIHPLYIDSWPFTFQHQGPYGFASDLGQISCVCVPACMRVWACECFNFNALSWLEMHVLSLTCQTSPCVEETLPS